MRAFLMVSILACLLTGCTTSANLPEGQAAYAVMPALTGDERPPDYRIGPLDELTITVFQEPDLSVKEAPVDASGNILMALVGQVKAEGKTTSELANDIAARLGTRFLVDPQVSVIINRSVSQRVTVDGQVKKPGVYEIERRTSLVQAVAMAEGLTETANTKEVYVFRRMEGKQYGAKFNLKLIRLGEAPDPQILGSDIVVVGQSALKGVYQDFLKASPFLGSIFIATQQN